MTQQMGQLEASERSQKPLIKNLIAAAGLKPAALKLYNLYRKVLYSFKPRFHVNVGNRQVTFVTEDEHSKHFFHYRYKNGEMHEPPVSEELIARAQDAKVFADVGAHLGYYACLAGALNPDLKLYLFEMNRNLVELIEHNLKANELNSAEVVNQAVSDRTKSIGYADGSVDAGLSMHAPGELSGEVIAESVSLDEFFESKGVMPDVIKIDVQGAEMEALRGAEQILRRRQPIIFLEVHPTFVGAFGTTPQDVYGFLAETGYDEIYLINEHRRDTGRLIKLDLEKGGPAHTHMLVCIGSRQH